MSLSVPSHAPHLHLPALRVPALPSGLPVATVLLSVLYAAALAVALTAPGQHAVAGCVVLAGLVGRTVVRRRRSTAAAVTATAAAVDSIAVLPAEAPAT
ncbi:hypothetical protein [Modestobacter altitudinis]|uniref:hypothetical protein n=1 Tax=Modestobacter altitudinis TaxID=2213158 RepID=UPI001FE381C5|nr:hypothetical protein [Modestobacter altitudinis]